MKEQSVHDLINKIQYHESWSPVNLAFSPQNVWQDCGRTKDYCGAYEVTRSCHERLCYPLRCNEHL